MTAPARILFNNTEDNRAAGLSSCKGHTGICKSWARVPLTKPWQRDVARRGNISAARAIAAIVARHAYDHDRSERRPTSSRVKNTHSVTRVTQSQRQELEKFELVLSMSCHSRAVFLQASFGFFLCHDCRTRSVV